jgi:enoyl-CoA hydratase/carnithine racemase
MRLTAADQHELGVVDEVIPEPGDGAHTDAEATARSLSEAIARHLDRLADRDLDVLLDERLARYRRMGQVASIGPIRRPRRRHRRGMTDRLRELLVPPRREAETSSTASALQAYPAEDAGPVQERLPLQEEV